MEFFLKIEVNDNEHVEMKSCRMQKKYYFNWVLVLNLRVEKKKEIYKLSIQFKKLEKKKNSNKVDWEGK